MKHIALTGPAYAGKTTLAKELERRGYLLISFTDLLKGYACRALSALDIHTSVQEISQKKEQYRPFLQELSLLIGWGQNLMYVHEALDHWYRSGRPACVFDNVRDARQAEELQWIGFTLVELDLPPYLLALRATNQPRRDHPVERPLPAHLQRVHLDAGLSVEHLADLLMERQEG